MLGASSSIWRKTRQDCFLQREPEGSIGSGGMPGSPTSPWVSGSQNGAIEIDDHGEPFRVVGEEALDGCTVGEDGSLYKTASGKPA